MFLPKKLFVTHLTTLSGRHGPTDAFAGLLDQRVDAQLFHVGTHLLQVLLGGLERVRYELELAGFVRSFGDQFGGAFRGGGRRGGFGRDAFLAIYWWFLQVKMKLNIKINDNKLR